MKLRDELMKGIYAYGFDKPSSVQQRAIMPIIEGKDMIVQSQAGTGKTCPARGVRRQSAALNRALPVRKGKEEFSFRKNDRTT